MTWHTTADADQLMEQLRVFLRDLSGKLWTNHNPADPGITTAEVLCFAIADLSYRTGFDIKDLLASYPGSTSTPTDLAGVDVVLPSAPVTLSDLRKVLVD
ncbi:MAG TPA: diguanylate cyclase, partial [Cytophagales bacterium]|nr:diguanylate cyclase [Cytophagales bacterium]